MTGGSYPGQLYPGGSGLFNNPGVISPPEPSSSPSAEFRTAARQPIKPEIRAALTVLDNELEGDPTVIGSDGDLQSFKIEATSGLLKTTMRKLTVKLVSDDYNFIAQPTYVKPAWGLKLPGDIWEDIDYGSFLVTEQTSDKEKGSMTLTAYDLMIRAYVEYDATKHTYPCSMAEFLQQICNALGIANGMQGMEFINHTLPIDIDYYATISGTTYRDILEDIAEATCSTVIIGRDDTFYLKTITETGEDLDETTLKKLKLESPYGEVKAIVLSRMPQEDNIALYDDESGAMEDGELAEIKIINNELLDKRRQETIQSIYDGLYGTAFVPFDANTIGLGWYEIGDRVTVENAGDDFSCVVFNYVLEVDGSVKERLYTNIPTKTATNYQRAGDMLRHLYNTEIVVDKQQQYIESLVSDMYGEDGLINENFTSILQDLTSVITSVQNAGGNNLIKNSAAYMLDNDQLPVDWTTDITGSLITAPSAEAVAKGSLSGNTISLIDAKMVQRVSIKPDSPDIAEASKTYYSFAAKVKKGAVGTGYIKLSNALEEHLIEFESGDEPDWQTFEITGLLPLQNYYDIEVYGDEDADLLVTDMILAIGQYSSQWQQANGEFANTQVQINIDGVTVRSSTLLGTYTKMTPLEFSGYKDGNLVFSINVNGLQVEKALIAHEIQMTPIKMVKMEGGMAFVPGEDI